ncbi:hypothetical protein SAMN05216227_102033 [Pseudorhodobacter antarcticus]|jgi:hypothetical protein|uniref:Uncharacterized protein n=1 Tax=Pseudorhodobacter antarcticus TaxID=1077947 RepID=A0A1H8IG59_9RHOB|nr:hypothetical protein [Pseudorhodobacter antarcticus]SEN67524.1 hypothetical protein SAMN05216227_102033 [Pseudorhodobacter antarcticus]
MFAPYARIAIRYGVGIFAGVAIGNAAAADPDIVIAVSAVIGVITEYAYVYAKRKGWAT